jgi:hypothetical protein
MVGDGEAQRRSPLRRPLLRRSLVFLLVLVVGGVGGYTLRAATEPVPPPPDPVPPSAQAAPTVPAPPPCIALADHAEELNAQLERAVQAVASLDPAALREIVNDVERVHDRMQPAVQACRSASGGG